MVMNIAAKTIGFRADNLQAQMAKVQELSAQFRDSGVGSGG
jgi:hypothetical protein